MSPDVVIVGGGPAGLLMACELALAGVRPLVLELRPGRAAEPTANGLVGRVVQALDYRGLYGRLSAGNRPPTPAPYFAFGALPLDMSGWDGNALYTLPVPQRRLEDVLEERARELGAEIRRGHEVVAVGQDADRVTAQVRGPDGPYQLSARFLVGADGGHSTIRRQAGIAFPGITGEGFVSRSGEVTIHPPVAVPGTGELDVASGVGRLRPASFTRTENGMFTYGMFRPGVYRVAVYEWGQPPVPDGTAVPISELQAAARRVLGGDVPMSAPPGGAPLARARTGANSRLADRYRQGRVFLAGDAAHVQSGIGGPALNLGLQDVLNLGWKLAGAVRGWAPDGLLDTYHSARHPAGARVIMQSRAQLALLSPGPDVTALRDVFAELLREQGAVRHLSDLMSGADICYDMRPAAPAHPMTGRWAPDLALDRDGAPSRVAELMRPARPVLLDLAGCADLAAVAAEWADRVDVVRASSAAPPAAAILIRPDGYVAWADGPEAPDGPGALRHALSTWFGSGSLAPVR